jgi:hypothetical protein
MDCNKSKMKKKKYMKENETFTSLKDFYKEILSETRAKAERAVMSDYDPTKIPGNKRNLKDFPKLTAAGNPKQRGRPGEEGPRFVNPKDTPKPGKANRTKKSVSIAGRVRRHQQKVARLIPDMTPSGLKRASQVLQDRGIQIPPVIDPKKLPPNMRSFDFAYNVDNSDQAFRNTNKIRF